ncbi:hypothetical protein Q9966_009444 [Columba livia]|nr:hypothetical protein Q9966_009444 [Columba livia]
MYLGCEHPGLPAWICLHTEGVSSCGSSCLHRTNAAQVPNPARSNTAGKTQPRRSRKAEHEHRLSLLPSLRDVPERGRIKQTLQWGRIGRSGTIRSSGQKNLPSLCPRTHLEHGRNESHCLKSLCYNGLPPVSES